MTETQCLAVEVINERDARTQRRVKAYELRKSGMTYPQIAGALNVSVSVAHGDVRVMLNQAMKSPDHKLSLMRVLESDRLDMAAVAVARQVRNGDLRAVACWLRISDLRRKLLGLDRLEDADRGEPMVCEILLPLAPPPVMVEAAAAIGKRR